MKIVGGFILVSYLILFLTEIYCTFAANVPEPPEEEDLPQFNSTNEFPESAQNETSPRSILASFIFFPFPVIAPNTIFGQMIRNFFRNNTFGASWVPLPMFRPNSSKLAADSTDPPSYYPEGILIPASPEEFPPNSTVSVNTTNSSMTNSTSASNTTIMNLNNGSKANANNSSANVFPPSAPIG